MNNDWSVEGRVAVVCVVGSLSAAAPGCRTEASSVGSEQSVWGAADAGSETQRTSSEAVESTPLFGGSPTTSHAVTSSSASPGTSDAPGITRCERAVADGAEPTIDDFEDGDQQTPKQDGRDGSWYFYDDGTTGTSTVNFGVDATGKRPGGVLSVAGSGFSDWGSGFGVGFNWNEGPCTYDASLYDGVRFWVRGFGQARLTFQNLSVRPIAVGGQCPVDASCFDSHGVSFEIPEAWTLLQFELADFVQAGWGTPVGPLQSDAVFLMEFQFGAAEPFAIALDDVEFFRRAEDGDAGAGGSRDVASSTDGVLDAGWGGSGEMHSSGDAASLGTGAVDGGEMSGEVSGEVSRETSGEVSLTPEANDPAL